jgi:thiosulfate/3-mercaptopyruvate sulfurtransferase
MTGLPAPDFAFAAGEENLITPRWLARNLGRTSLSVLDLRADVRDYWQGHVPGAVYFNPEAMRLADHGVPVKLAPPEVLAAMLGAMGVDRKAMVVVYSEGNDYKATYMIWALDYIGHANSALLDGGFGRWQAEGQPITQDYPQISPVAYDLPVDLQTGVRALLNDVRRAITEETAFALRTVVIDVRPRELYSGEKGFGKQRGHIKGAINHFWGDDLNPDGSWRSREELLETYAGLGVTPDTPVIVYCGQGQMSSHTYFTMKYILGYSRVRNYDGGFNEWSSSGNMPVASGSQ